MLLADFRTRARALARRIYQSPAVPRRLRDRVREARLDRYIRRAARTRLAHANPPVTFNDKVRYKMLKDRRPLLTTFADKVAVRRYVEARVGKEILTELFLVTKEPEEVRQQSLPREFVLKPSHASGAGVFVSDRIPPHDTLPEPRGDWAYWVVSPHSLDWDWLRKLCRGWLSRVYKPKYQWAYRNIPSRILVEELLLADGSIPPDYKLFVFHGRVRLIQVDRDRFGDHIRNFYSPEWDAVPVKKKYSRGAGQEKPSSLLRMISIAEALGAETDFVRVDLYEVEDRVVFGELTSYPAAGKNPFEPESFNHEIGAWWSPPRDYRSLPQRFLEEG